MSLKNTYRKEGLLSRMKRNTIPKHVLYYDTETYVNTREDGIIDFTFRLGVAIYVVFNKDATVKKREVFRFSSEDEFIDLTIELARGNKALYVFAHNQGFDLRVLNAFEKYHELGFESKPPIINNLVFIWGAKNKKTKIDFIDTANLGIRSVSQLGQDMGYDKLDVDFANVSDEDLFVYCQRDVEILEKFVNGYIRYIYENKLGSFKVTLASQSLTAFRTNLMSDDIHIHNHNGSLKLERDGYYGGRTECFKLGYLGYSKWYYLDVNSMYPSAMVNFPLPAKLIGYGKDVSIKEFRQHLKRYYVIADVTIETDKNIFPLRMTNKQSEYNYLKNPNNLEYPHKSSKRLIFPTGRFRTTLHYQELLDVIKSSKIIHIHRMSIYTKSNPFNDYIKFFYDAKNKYGQEGNKTWRLISKLFLNSLYGKFGQLQPQRKFLGKDYEFRYFRLPEYDNVGEIFRQRLYWNYDEYIEFKHGETSFSNPALAGAITANARMILNNFISISGNKNTFYCDTDSLIVNEDGYKNLIPYIDSSKIGFLDIEHISRRVIIRGNKDYRIDKVKKHKGLSPNAKKTGSNEWEFLQFQGFITWWNNGAIEKMIGEYRTKSRVGVYKKGIMRDDNSIIPYHLQE